MDGYEIDPKKIPSWARVTSAEPTEGEIDGLRCNGCDHVWATRVEQPKSCPGCDTELVWNPDEKVTLNMAEINEAMEGPEGSDGTDAKIDLSEMMEGENGDD